MPILIYASSVCFLCDTPKKVLGIGRRLRGVEYVTTGHHIFQPLLLFALTFHTFE